ncbi:unnamed protein product [Owenia fusiformis]|uniref:COX assembly mitochondrial protein n=1 Tax=Owenia fusiformis TaxID=6347 RepID=A0A8J1Y1G6_OWEFU|nr:unnamed protein product [Owenia fusiformis]
MSEKEEKGVLPGSLSGGPHGLGDPDDKSLRRVETEVIIPKKVRDKARIEKCTDLVAVFSKCGKDNGLLFPFKCREENAKMQECLTVWYKDKDFVAQCTEEYLEERTDYRRTGIKQKFKRMH